jgi:hypothetical protein
MYSPRANWTEVLAELGPETQNRRYAVSSYIISHQSKKAPSAVWNWSVCYYVRRQIVWLCWVVARNSPRSE